VAYCLIHGAVVTADSCMNARITPVRSHAHRQHARKMYFHTLSTCCPSLARVGARMIVIYMCTCLEEGVKQRLLLRRQVVLRKQLLEHGRRGRGGVAAVLPRRGVEPPLRGSYQAAGECVGAGPRPPAGCTALR
jgi:hypothetical protein